MAYTQITLNSSSGLLAVFSGTDVESISAALEQIAGTAPAFFQMSNSVTAEFNVAGNIRYINRNSPPGLSLYQLLNTSGTYSFNDFHNYNHWANSQFFFTANNNLFDTFSVRLIVDTTGSGPVHNTSLYLINTPGPFSSGVINAGWNHITPNAPFVTIDFEINNTTGSPNPSALVDLTFSDQDDFTVLDTVNNFSVGSATQTYTMTGTLDYFRRLRVDAFFH